MTSSLSDEEVTAKWVLLAEDIQNMRDLVNGDRFHVSRYAQELFEDLREHYGQAGNPVR